MSRALLGCLLALVSGCSCASEELRDGGLDAAADAGLFDGGALDVPTLDTPDASVVDVPVDAPTYSEACGHRFENGEIVHIEPFYRGGLLEVRLAHEIDWAADEYVLYDLDAACIVVAARNIVAGDVLDGALTQPWWNRLGRPAGERMWVLDWNHLGWIPGSGNPPLLGVLAREVDRATFPSGMDWELTLTSAPAQGHVAAWQGPPDPDTEPEWLTTTFDPLPPHHFEFSAPPGPPIIGHPYSWSFTQPGHYFVRVSVGMDATDGRRVTGSGVVHIVVEAPIETPCGICESPTRFCDEDTTTCVQCEVGDDCLTFTWDRPPYGPYEACFEGSCVECNTSDDCPNYFIPECDVATHTCVPCTSNEPCAAHWPDTPICHGPDGCGI